jgi:hypothetical protein
MLVPVSEIIPMTGKLMRKDFANVGGKKGQDAGNYYYHSVS